MRKLSLIIIQAVFFALALSAQDKKVLFIGNSYTFIEDIPNMFYQAANSTGDNILVDAQTAGSATFEFHTNSVDVTNKINSNDWDYVVLQGSSVEVGLTGDYFNNSVAPFAAELCETVRYNNTCTQPVFYRTWAWEWGMSNSGPTCIAYPWMCYYHSMDDEIAQNYRVLADDNDAVISPVGQVWRYMRDNLVPVDLYHEDQSHQSLEGAYASACTFYTTILRKDPTLITYNPGISASKAEAIRNAVKVVVYDQLSFWKIDEFDPKADFTFNELGNEVTFLSTSENGESYYWDFGDSNTSTQENPIHVYDEIGEYAVRLTVEKCGMSDSYEMNVNINTLGTNKLNSDKIKLIPNPSSNIITLKGVNFDRIQSIKLYNLMGKQIPLDYMESNLVFDISYLSSGAYFIKIKTIDNNTFIKKLIKS
ncbi:PKD domain-containing protein [Flavobacteriaceae sp. LMIT009]